MGMESGDGGPALCTQIYGVNVDLWCTKYEGSYVWGCYSYEGGVTCGGETYCTTSGSGAANLELPYYVFSEDMAYDYNTVEVLLGGSPGTGNYSDMWGYTITYQN
jgi:hypothetical protein